MEEKLDREAKIIDIDKKKKRPKDRALGNTRNNRDRARVNAVHRNKLGAIREILARRE